MPTADERDRAKKGIKARHDAVTTLIANHREEFDEMVKNNRLALGLPAKPSGPTADEIKAKIARAEQQLRKWRQDLDDAA